MTTTVGADQFLPVFRTPNDVRAYKRSLDPLMTGMNASVEACTKLDEATRNAWGDFYKAWRGFYAEEESWWHTVAQWLQTEKYEARLSDWQTLLGARCGGGMSIPTVEPPGKGDSDFNRTLRTVAVAGAVVAVVIGVRAVIR